MNMALLSIGDFARATHLSVKTLRYYHDARLLEPAEIDSQSGYRRYDVGQIPTAQVIRRFRDLGMPVEDVRAVLQAPDPGTRSDLIARHLRRLEDDLGRTQAAVSSLRDLLEHPVIDLPVEHRHVPAGRVAAISGTVATAEVGAWLQGALGELHATASAQGADDPGVAGGIYDNGLFESGGGSAVVYLPRLLRPVGRVQQLDLPGRRPGGGDPLRPRGPNRPCLRVAGGLCRPARPGRQRPRPRVLPGQPPAHQGSCTLADRDRLASFPDPPP